MADDPVTRLNSYVGFDSITRQIEHKLLKRGFQFNVMVVGQTGLGKSTLINTIFASHLIDSKGRLDTEDVIRQTTEIQAVSHSQYPSSVLTCFLFALRPKQLSVPVSTKEINPMSFSHHCQMR